jgi:hypothetical protein
LFAAASNNLKVNVTTVPLASLGEFGFEVTHVDSPSRAAMYTVVFANAAIYRLLPPLTVIRE